MFKTIESDITKSGKSLAFFGKSTQNIYADINSAINGISTSFQQSRDEGKSFIQSLSNGLSNKNLSQFSIKRILGNSLSQKDIESVKEYNKAINDCIDPQTAFYRHLGNSSAAAQKLARDANGAAVSEKVLDEATQHLTISQRAANIALNAFANIGFMVAINLIIAGISKAVNRFKEIEESSEKLIDKFKGLKEQTDSLAKNSDELVEEYAKLAKGVDNLGENVSLTADEYERYQELSNQIAEDIPNLVIGYDNEGNAILRVRDSVNELRDAYIEARKEAYNLALTDDSTVNDAITHYQNLADHFYIMDFGLPTVGTDWFSSVDVREAVKYLNVAIESSYDELQELLKTSGNADNPLYINGAGYLKGLGFDAGTTEEEFEELRSTFKLELKKLKAQIETGLESIRDAANMYLFTEDNYYTLEEDMQKIASIIVNNIPDELAQTFTEPPDIQAYVEDIVEKLKNATPEITSAFNSLFNLQLDNKSISEAKSQVDGYIQTIADYLGLDANQLKIQLGFEIVDENAEELNHVINRIASKYTGSLSDRDTESYLNSAKTRIDERSINTKEELALFAQCVDEADNLTEAFERYDEKVKEAAETNKKAEEELKTLSDISSEASKKISLIKTAMEEMGEAGSISASTFAELSESGIDLNECLDIVNGKFVVNIEKLKDLEKQTYLDEIATDQLRLAELELARAQTKAHGGDISWFDDEIERLKQDITFKGALAKEIDNAKPDDNSGGGDGGNGDSEKPDSIVNFEKELAEKQHEINMGRMKEDAAYWDWYESAYKKVYEGQKDYQDDMYKHEEAVYNGRKKLAEDAFEAEKKAFESSVSKHEDNIDRAKDRGYDADGNYLDTDSRAKYIEGEYDRIITDIQNRINALIADGAEKNKDEIESLEKDLESWQNKKSDFIYNTGKTNFDNRITDLEKQIEKTEKDSTDFEGKKLDTSEKYDYIRSSYDDILTEINNRISEIIESGVEGHEEELEELNEMYEEYTDKRESTYDDEINHEISVLEKLKDKESDRFDEQIKKLEEQKDAVEDSYDDEIKKIDEKIKAIQDENDEQERSNDLEKARQELEKSSQRTRKVYGSNGMVEYRQDDEAIAEAQKNYDNVKKDIEIAELEKQKEALEANKEAEISKYDEMINAVNQQKDSQIQYWDYLIDILETYLNPDSLESSSELWDRILNDREKVRQEQGQTIVNGQAIDNPNGKTANANEINENINNAIKANTETAESNANAAKANEESAKTKQQEETTSISPEEAEMKFAQTLGQFFMNGLLLANNGMTASSQFMNEQHGEAATAVNTNNAVNNYNNSPITNNTFTIGDILITNPVGNSDDLAKELRMNIPISFQNQIYSNKKK